MADDRETITTDEKPSVGKFQRRQIFVSHAHADRKLALGVRKLVEEAFSGLVSAYVSSDPTPTGGVKPGEETWYAAIHAKLSASDSVWVLATPASVSHPWIYWEAGFGSAACASTPIVLRVRISNTDLPSPLSNFQTYDGLVEGDGGVGELLGKVGKQLGMDVSPVLVESVAKRWVSAAEGHEPEANGEEAAPPISPEHLNPLGALIARLETAISSLTARGTARGISPLTTLTEPPRFVGADKDTRIVGRAVGPIESVAELASTVDGAPADTVFEFDEIDEDGDARIYASLDDEVTSMWLLAAALKGLKIPRSASRRVRALVKEIVEATS